MQHVLWYDQTTQLLSRVLDKTINRPTRAALGAGNTVYTTFVYKRSVIYVR